MILSVAWKNVWRNKLRSLVVIFAVIIGLLAGSFGVAIMEGVTKTRAKSQINNEISHIQIHNPKFSDNNEAKYRMNNYNEIENYISSLNGYKSSSSRICISGMLNTSGGNTAAYIYGINPEKEKTVTEIYKHITNTNGTYFEGNKKNEVLISETLAKKLKLDRYKVTNETVKKLFDSGFPESDTIKLQPIKNIQYRTHKDYFNELRKIFDTKFVEEYEYLFLNYAIEFKSRASLVISFQNKKSEITGDKFKITGIYKTSNRMYDEMSVFVNKKYLASLIGYEDNESHEIAILLNNRDETDDFAKKIKEKFPDLEIKTWKEIDPMLVMIAEYMVIYNYILIAFILVALSFGIINTMLMAIMERTKELGMLAAIGMNRKRIFSMIMVETIFLTITGAIVGLVTNFFIISKLSKTGIDLTKQMGEAFEAIGYNSKIYPDMGLEYYVGITLLVIFAAILSSIYPAIKAVKLNPAEAVRSDA